MIRGRLVPSIFNSLAKRFNDRALDIHVILSDYICIGTKCDPRLWSVWPLRKKITIQQWQIVHATILYTLFWMPRLFLVRRSHLAFSESRTFLYFIFIGFCVCALFGSQRQQRRHHHAKIKNLWWPNGPYYSFGEVNKFLPHVCTYGNCLFIKYAQETRAWFSFGLLNNNHPITQGMRFSSKTWCSARGYSG